MQEIKKVLKLTCIFLIMIVSIASVLFLTDSLLQNQQEVATNPEIAGYTVTIDLNGADKVARKSLQCTMEMEQCYVVLPNAIKDNGVVLGYSSYPNSTTPEFQIGDKINVTQNMKLYVVSKKTNTLYIEGKIVDNIDNRTLECSAYNKENRCMIEIPSFNVKGYENRGYSTSPNSLVGFIFPNEQYVISKDVTLYPIYGVNNHLQKLDIVSSYQYSDSIIEIENGCTENIYRQYLEYLEEISLKAPFLLLGNKISLLNDDSFDTIWGPNYVGMNYGPRNLRAVDIRCGTKLVNDYYGTMIHEFSHSWDFYYAFKTGNNLSNESDVINLYNKYSKLTERPFRAYSYSSIYEFLADSVKYYYFKFIVPRNEFDKLDYPSDIQKTIEKYICIAQNNYDIKQCKGV